MKKLLVFLLAVSLIVPTFAQSGLETLKSSQWFNKKGEAGLQNYSLSEVSSAKAISDYHLTYYRCAKMSAPVETLKAMVADIEQDAQGADRRDIHRTEGMLDFAILGFDAKDSCRLLCFQCRPAEKGRMSVVLLYMEGNVPLDSMSPYMKSEKVY